MPFLPSPSRPSPVKAATTRSPVRSCSMSTHRTLFNILAILRTSLHQMCVCVCVCVLWFVSHETKHFCTSNILLIKNRCVRLHNSSWSISKSVGEERAIALTWPYVLDHPSYSKRLCYATSFLDKFRSDSLWTDSDCPDRTKIWI